MTNISARVILTALAELDGAGCVHVLLKAGGFTLGAATISPGDWPKGSDPVPQGKVLCRALPALKGFASMELVESTRLLVARAFSGESALAGGANARDVAAEGSPLSLLGPSHLATRTSRLVIGEEARDLLADADLVRGQLRSLEGARDETLAELVAIRLVEEGDRVTLTPLGLRVAARIKAGVERPAEEMGRGASFATYVAGEGLLGGELDVAVTDGGEDLYGNDSVVVRGKLDGGEGPGAAALLSLRWEEAISAPQREVVPVAFSSAAIGGRRVWFSNRASVSADAFDHVARGRNDLTFTAEAGRRSGTGAINVYHCGARVAAITCHYGASPEVVRELTRRVGRDRLVRPTVAVQGTLLFVDDLVFVLEVPQRRAGARDAAADRRLITAARCGDLQGMREALEAGADLEARDAEGGTPLINAAAWGRYRAAQFLLRHGADPLARNGHRRTALMAAASEGYGEVVCLLAAHLVGRDMRAELDAADAGGNTAMHWAAREGKRTIINYLRLFGADASRRNAGNRTPGQEAQFFGRPSAAEACRTSKLSIPRNASPEAGRLITRTCSTGGRVGLAAQPSMRKAG